LYAVWPVTRSTDYMFESLTIKIISDCLFHLSSALSL